MMYCFKIIAIYIYIYMYNIIFKISYILKPFITSSNVSKSNKKYYLNIIKKLTMTNPPMVFSFQGSFVLFSRKRNYRLGTVFFIKEPKEERKK